MVYYKISIYKTQCQIKQYRKRKRTSSLSIFIWPSSPTKFSSLIFKLSSWEIIIITTEKKKERKHEEKRRKEEEYEIIIRDADDDDEEEYREEEKKKEKKI